MSDSKRMKDVLKKVNASAKGKNGELTVIYSGGEWTTLCGKKLSGWAMNRLREIDTLKPNEDGLLPGQPQTFTILTAKLAGEL